MPDGQQNATLTEGSTNASPRKPSRRRFLILGAAVVALVGVAFWLINWWTTGRFVETTNNAYLQADSVVISPKISGYVKEVLVRDNELVAAGAPLARIDRADGPVGVLQGDLDLFGFFGPTVFQRGGSELFWAASSWGRSQWGREAGTFSGS